MYGEKITLRSLLWALRMKLGIFLPFVVPGPKRKRNATT
jgi:hypothetical protein